MGTWPSGLGAAEVVFALYAFIFGSVLVTDQLPSTPVDQNGLNLIQAWKDLHIIATRPHPYNSHANEIVHVFLLSPQLLSVVSAYPHVHLVEDRLSNGSWDQTYFEGTNILVKCPRQMGVPYYLEHMIITVLPSAAENDADCVMDKDRSGMVRREWNSGDEMLSLPGLHGPVLNEEEIEPHSDTFVYYGNPWLRSRIK
ncbi:hypothetical protein Hypma_015173 [Hypsizygus marmoreus]|uniref:Uncharacterized protein n=1 Tax=Hypsizygus marmoreus TaxID=39966 RepID=A0A369KD48_HYPMA|nr:hypothetical protein Hypma_015173 [Hypsizygus marmoreus]